MPRMSVGRVDWGGVGSTSRVLMMINIDTRAGKGMLDRQGGLFKGVQSA